MRARTVALTVRAGRRAIRLVLLEGFGHHLELELELLVLAEQRVALASENGDLILEGFDANELLANERLMLITAFLGHGRAEDVDSVLRTNCSSISCVQSWA